MVFYKILWWWPQVYTEFKEYVKIQTSKYLRSWIYVRTYIQPCVFEHHPFMISFEDLSLIIYIWVFNTTIKVIMKQNSI